jgi:hypothetical protein
MGAFTTRRLGDGIAIAHSVGCTPLTMCLSGYNLCRAQAQY